MGVANVQKSKVCNTEPLDPTFSPHLTRVPDLNRPLPHSMDPEDARLGRSNRQMAAYRCLPLHSMEGIGWT